ncbi:hypothetical protein I4641_05045 [Waterburya agarophytonicola K14]|uniref:Haloacid dehalogenase-like hydrolase n=1 Tax=Waterburya agarophytonicola KI4 TaxID=2874699 RepID=A0A964BQ81_9CYAN|nr:hypothetical protein [Waterburya agarophytonicola]MCC0176342.1 hypothetical protein [Waterburya agarophytonicola KI4]
MQNDSSKQLILIDKSETLKLIQKASHTTSIILDFDETLFLRNSTAEYLNSLRPRLLGLLLIKTLSLIKPWFWLPKPFQGSKVKDWFLVTIPTLLLPWTIFLWQIKAQKLAEKYSNKELIDAIKKNSESPVVIATLGFNFIINPILKYMFIRHNIEIGCRFWQGAKDRSKGKLLMLREQLSESSIKSAILVTDSLDDKPLLDLVEKPCLIIWSLAKYIPPLKDVYLPFFYLKKVKRVGEKYILKVILWDDLPILLLAFSWQAINPTLHGISILFLLVSFWCVYELGYYENDRVAEKYEEKPKLSITYHLYKQMMTTWYPLFWSLLFGVIGITLLNKAQGVQLLFSSQVIETYIVSSNPILATCLYWFGLLFLSRLCFWVYNHLNKHTRTWLYLLLQSFRYYGFLAVTSTNPIGTSLLSSHVLSRSVLYVVYRYSGGDVDHWPKQVPEKLLRWLIFIFLLSAIALGSQSLELWQNWQTWTIMAWCLIQGQGQIRRMLSEVKPVFKDGSNRVKPATQ